MEDLKIIQRCRAGDQTAFEMLYQKYALKALRTTFLMTHQPSLAEDAVQETFVQVWASIDKLRDENAFRAWFFRILINRIRNLGKRDGGNHNLPLEIATNLKDERTRRPEEQVEQNEELHRVQVAVALLPEPQRVTLILRYYSELSEAEIGEALGIPSGTVKSRLHAARARLQEYLSKDNAHDKLSGPEGNLEARR